MTAQQDDCVRIPIYGRSDVVVAYALVSREDAHLGSVRWNLVSRGYVGHRNGRTTEYMHRAVLGLTAIDRLHVDHINHDILDNRRSNLRAVTARQNLRNRLPNRKASRSGLRHIDLSRNGTYRVRVGKLCGGTFKNQADAERCAAELRAQLGYITTAA